MALTKVQTALTNLGVYNVLDYGAVGDGTTDDKAAIQAAIDAAELAGGGTVFLPTNIYAIATGLVVDNNNVTLKGEGQGTHYANGKADIRASAATTLKWTGATGSGTMVTFTTDAADSGTNLQRSCGGLGFIFLDMQEKALIGLLIQTWTHGVFENINIGWAGTSGYGLKVTTLDAGCTAGASDTQHNEFTSIQYNESNTAVVPTAGMWVGSGANVAGGTGNTGNTSSNSWRDIYLHMWGISAGVSGAGVIFENCDTNYFYFLRVSNHLGTGATTTLHSQDSGTTAATSWGGSLARYNQFHGCDFNGGLIAKTNIDVATPLYPSFGNMVIGQAGGNGSGAFNIEPGAELQYWRSGDNLKPPTILSELSASNLSCSWAPNYTGATDNGSGPYLKLFRESANPADFDLIGIVLFKGRNDAAQAVTYGTVGGIIYDVTDGTEDGGLYFTSTVGGATVTQLEVYNGLRIGPATGSYKGRGTINVSAGVYINNISIRSGTSSPEGAVTAPVSSLFMQTDGAIDAQIWVKEGGTGNTGWGFVNTT